MIQFQVNGVTQLNRKLSRYTKDVKDWRGAWPSIKDVFYKGEEEQFATETGAGPWEQLSPTYEIWKRRNFPGAKILERTGHLGDTLAGKTGDLRWNEKAQDLAVEVMISYSSYHQDGTINMPKRELIYLQEGTKRDITQALHRWLVWRQKANRL